MSLSKYAKRTLPQESAKRKKYGSLTITLCLHALLWLSCGSVILGGVMFIPPLDGVLVPSASLVEFASASTLVYIMFHCWTAHIRRLGKDAQYKNAPRHRTPAYALTRFAGFLAIAWLIAAAWCAIIAARATTCLPVTRDTPASWQAGTPCIVQRIATLFSFLALIASCVLFVMVSCVKSPFDSHLLGRIDIEKQYTAKDWSSQFDSTTTIHRMQPPSPIVATPTTPPPHLTEVISRPGTALAKPEHTRSHSAGANLASSSKYASNQAGPSTIQKQIHRSASDLALRNTPLIHRIPSSSSLSSYNSYRSAPTGYHHARSISAPHHPFQSTTSLRYSPSAMNSLALQQHLQAQSQQLTYTMSLLANSTHAFNSKVTAPSNWSAVHPPRSDFMHNQKIRGLKPGSHHSPSPSVSGGSVASFASLRSMPVSTNPALIRMRHQQQSWARRGPVPVYAHSWSGGGRGGNLKGPTRATAGAGGLVRPMPALHRATSSHSSGSSARGKGSLASEVLFEEDEEDEADTAATSVSGGTPLRRQLYNDPIEPTSPSMIIDHYFDEDEISPVNKREEAPGGLYPTRLGRNGSIKKLRKGMGRRLSKGKGKAVVVHM